MQIPPPLFQDDCCLFDSCFALLLPRPFIRNGDRRLLRFIVVFGGRASLRWLRAAPQVQNNYVVSCLLLPSPEQLIVISPSQSPPSRLFIKSIRTGLGPIVSSVPPPQHILCRRATQNSHRPIFVLPRRLFHQPHSKIDGLDGCRGEGRHQR